MKKTYFDEYYFEKEIEIEENADLVLEKLNFIQKIIMECKLKTSLLDEEILIKAFQCDIADRDIQSFFSDKVIPVLEKIKKHKGVKKLSFCESIIFVCDFVMPIVYGKTELDEESRHLWIMKEARIYWNGIPKDIRKTIYSISYNDNYKEVILGKEEIISHEISKNQKIKKILTPCIDITWNYNALLEVRPKISTKTYAYCVRYLYGIQTRDVSLEILHKAFEGLSKDDFMFEDDFKVYNSLPDKICIYRGTDADEVIPRPSWTLNLDVARTFSHGKIMKATIAKECMMAYFNTYEEEVLVWVNKEEVEEYYTIPKEC